MTPAPGDHRTVRVQAGVRARACAAGGVYVPIEAHLRGFNDFVLAQLGVADDAPDRAGVVPPA